MKKLILFLSLCGIARAVGTVQQTTQQVGNTAIYTVSLYWTGDAITGIVPVTLIQAQAIPIVQGYRVVNVETIPGSPAPTNNYTVTLLDTAGVDVLAGAASGIVSSSAAQGFQASPTSPPIFGSLSLSISGQSVGGAKGTVFIYLAPFSQIIGLAPSAPSFPVQGANLFLASPNGASGSPGFRAVAVPGDFGANAQGNGTKVQLAAGTATSGDCIKYDANGNAIDAGAACGTPIPAGTQLQILNVKPNTGNNTTLQFDNPPFVNVTDFAFPSYTCNVGLTCVQGGTSAGSLAVGNNSLTMTPVPLGMNGTDSGHYLFVSGGVGTAEACVINGGGGTAGQASGVIIINCANTHSGAWTLASATAGIQEELQNAASTNGSAYLPPGTYNVNGRISLPANVTLLGAGPAAVNINVATTSGANTNEITSIASGRLTGFTVTLTSAATMNCIEVDSFAFGLIDKVTCNGGQDGIRVNLGSGNSNFTDVQINNQSRNGLFVNADSSGEVRFTRYRVQQNSLAAGATGALITKTGTTNLGGIYFNDSLFNNMGTGLFYNSTLQSPMPLWVGNSIFDINNVGVNLVNNNNLKITGSWINSNGVSNSLILNGLNNFTITSNKILGAGSAGVQFLGTDTNGTIAGNDMSNTGTAFQFTSNPTVTGVLFRGNDIGSATLTNSVTLMSTASAGASYLTDGPLRSSQLNQSAALGATNLIVPAPAGQYRLSWYTVITQAATTSSGLQVNFVWNDGTASQAFTSANLTTNTLGANQNGSIMITNAASQNIQYSTNYASVGATVMKYNVYIILEML